jgi:hypothetical protein
MEMCEEE